VQHNVRMMNDSSSFNLSVNATGLCPRYDTADIILIKQASWWLEGVTQSILCVVGILTNTFSIFILARKELCNTFNQLLICLAVVDVIYMLCMLTISLGDVLQLLESVHIILTPYIIHPLKSITLSASVLMMISIATERYVAVYHPFSRLPRSVSAEDYKEERKRRIILHLLPVLTFSLIFNISKFMEVKLEYDEKTHKYKLNITSLRVNHVYNNVYAWSRVFVMGIIPLVLICILNYKIYLAIRLARKTRRQLTVDVVEGNTYLIAGMDGNKTVRSRPANREANDEHLSVMLLVIVLVFLLCNSSRCILAFYEVFILECLRNCIDEGKMGHGYPVWNILLGNLNHILLVLNPTLNFFVYCLIGRRFRMAVRKWLSELLNQEEDRTNTFSGPVTERTRITSSITSSFRRSRFWSISSMKTSIAHSIRSTRSTDSQNGRNSKFRTSITTTAESQKLNQERRSTQRSRSSRCSSSMEPEPGVERKETDLKLATQVESEAEMNQLQGDPTCLPILTEDSD